MSATAAKGPADFFNQALEFTETAMKTGVKLQEDSMKWWSDIVGEPAKIGDMQGKMRTVLDDVMPTARKNADESFRAIDRISSNNLELMKKALSAGPTGASPEIQDRVQKAWQDSMEIARKNAEALLDANERAMQIWSSCFQSVGDTMEKATKAATPKAAK